MTLSLVDCIFGYGSLMWRPGFDYLNKKPGRIDGYSRRFWQASPDHRGTEEEPGRVVTLVPSDHGITHGMVYWVAPETREQVLAELDVREQGGYVQKIVEAVLTTGDRVRCLTYFADHHNPHYLGPDGFDNMLGQIQRWRRTEWCELRLFVGFGVHIASIWAVG